MTAENEDVTSETEAKKEKSKFKDSVPKKIVVRRLPPSLTAEEFIEQTSPIPDHDFFFFTRDISKMGELAFTRAYINFVSYEDILIFQEKFDGYIFVDQKGNEFPAVVEFAPFQRTPKKKSRKPDVKLATIENDPDYLKFIENLEEKSAELTAPAVDTILEEIETKERELKENKGLKMTTPLIDFIKKKKEEKRAALAKARDERKKKEIEKRKQKEDERRKRREKEREKLREKEKQRKLDKEKKDSEGGAEEEPDQEEAKVTLLKNPDREKKRDEPRREKPAEKVRSEAVKPKERTWKEKQRETFRDRAKQGKKYERKEESRKGDESKKGEETKKEDKESPRTPKGKDTRPKVKEGERKEQRFDEKSPDAEGKSSNKPRIRYKDRPERAIYNPAKRAAERKKEKETDKDVQ